MKKIIFGIVFLMLVATIGVSAKDIYLRENIQTALSAVDDLVDVPLWEVGDSWIYNEHYSQFRYKSDGTPFLIYFLNCTSTCIVTDDTGDTYTVKLTSENTEGSLIMGQYRFKFTPFYKLTQEIEYRKTDLAYVRLLNQEKGPVIWLIGNIGIPIPAHYNEIWEVTYTPAEELFPFPLTMGKTGTFPSLTSNGHQKISLYFGLIKLVDGDWSDIEIPSRDYVCEMSSITVPAGTYEAYNVSTDWVVHKISLITIMCLKLGPMQNGYSILKWMILVNQFPTSKQS